MTDVNHKNKLRAKTGAIWRSIIQAFADAGTPQTVRQVYYKLTTFGAVPKTEAGYKTVGNQLSRMRREEVIPYEWITDNTRWMRKPQTYDSIHAFLEISKNTYRRALWQDQNDYVEIWCEKDSLAGVLSEVTHDYDVPLMVTKGYTSETFAYGAAEEIKKQSKTAYIYYFGDNDPSGVDMRDGLHKKLVDFGAKVEFIPAAVTPEQISIWNLPTRKTKRTDTRSKGWVGDSCELDAIPANMLRELAERCITRHIDNYQLEQTKRAEQLERESLNNVIENLGLDQNSWGGV